MCTFTFARVSGETKSFNSVKEFMTSSDDGMNHEIFGTKLPIRFTHKQLKVRIETQIATCNRWLDNLKRFQTSINVEEVEANEAAFKAYLDSLSPEKRRALLGE